MGCRYQKAADRINEVSFRVVEIFVVRNHDNKNKSSRFLLVDNGQETLETVQSEMQDFVRNAIMANRLGEPAGRNR